ncbi:MAG: SIMPL domain-containing protein [Pseudomonadota bacterium]
MRALLAATLALALAGGAAAEDSPSVLRVTGHGQAAAAPDMATVSLGVENQARTAQQALRDTSRATAALIEGLREAGVEDRDMQTSGLSLRPVYGQYRSGSSGPPRIEGFTASNRLTVRVLDLDGIGGVLDALVGAGANRIDGLSFGLVEPAPVLAAARRNAVEKARDAAETYAAAAGVTLGKILSIGEGGAVPIPRGGDIAMARVESAPVAVPIQQGETVLRASVTITWEIDD